MKTTRFYFAIAAANVLECIEATSFTEAKQIAAQDWLPYWDQIEWLNIKKINDESIKGL